jgi:hypothetical protein
MAIIFQNDFSTDFTGFTTTETQGDVTIVSVGGGNAARMGNVSSGTANVCGFIQTDSVPQTEDMSFDFEIRTNDQHTLEMFIGITDLSSLSYYSLFTPSFHAPGEGDPSVNMQGWESEYPDLNYDPVANDDGNWDNDTWYKCKIVRDVSTNDRFDFYYDVDGINQLIFTENNSMGTSSALRFLAMVRRNSGDYMYIRNLVITDNGSTSEPDTVNPNYEIVKNLIKGRRK